MCNSAPNIAAILVALNGLAALLCGTPILLQAAGKYHLHTPGDSMMLRLHTLSRQLLLTMQQHLTVILEIHYYNKCLLLLTCYVY